MRQLRRALGIALILTGLVAGIALADYEAVEPDNYCLTVTVEAVVNAGYNVTATGAGRYARIRDLTDNQTVVASDFGPGATLYTWIGLTVYELQQDHQYQVQVSHTSLTTGYSSSGCVFSPPLPQAVTIDLFEIREGAFYWISGMPDGFDYRVRLATPAGSRAEVWMTDLAPGLNPGGWGGEYWAKPLRDLQPGSTYELMAHDIYGEYGVAASFVYQPEPVERGAGPVIWKAYCPRWYELRQVPAAGGGMHVLCVRMA